MCAVEKIAACQISFIPIGTDAYLGHIDRVLDIVREKGLESDVGYFSTVVRGERSKVLSLITDIYKAMDSIRDFTMDVKLSNVCGCKIIENPS